MRVLSTIVVSKPAGPKAVVAAEFYDVLCQTLFIRQANRNLALC